MNISKNDLKKKIEGGEDLIVEFWSYWSFPSDIMRQYFKKVASSYDKDKIKFSFHEFNADSDRDYSNSLGVDFVPSLKFYSKGMNIFTKNGLIKEDEIKQLIKEVFNE